MVTPFFLAAPEGQRFCVYHGPSEGEPRGAVLFVPPFTEEMNKSRRMVSLAARALSAANYAVLVIDLYGCGDSSGDFAEATWSRWQEDIRLAAAWLRDRTDTPLWLWGLRSGCLLATAVAETLGEEPRLLFWQPATSGKLHLQQFLRLKMAGELLSGEHRGLVAGLRNQLANGQAVEIAGYTLNPTLSAEIEAAELLPSSTPGRLAWLEVSGRQDNPSLSPAAVKALAAWQTAGFRTTQGTLAGPAFWQTTEIAEAPDLIAATLAHLDALSP